MELKVYNQEQSIIICDKDNICLHLLNSCILTLILLFLESDESSIEQMLFHDELSDDISNESESFSSNEDTFIHRTTDAVSFSNELGVSPNTNDTTNAGSSTHQESNSTAMTLGDDSEEVVTTQSNNATVTDSKEDTTTLIEIEPIQNGKMCP